LQTDDQVVDRAGLAPAAVEDFQTFAAHFDDRLDHRTEAVEGLVLESHDVGRGRVVDSRRSGINFSQPRPTTIAWPPKFGLRARLRRVRIGISAPGASMATPQP